MSITLTTCNICDGKHSMMREHCPYCGARAVYIASHSYEPQRTRIEYRAVAYQSRVEIVRAIRSDVGFKFIAR